MLDSTIKKAVIFTLVEGIEHYVKGKEGSLASNAVFPFLVGVVSFLLRQAMLYNKPRLVTDNCQLIFCFSFFAIVTEHTIKLSPHEYRLDFR